MSGGRLDPLLEVDQQGCYIVHFAGLPGLTAPRFGLQKFRLHRSLLVQQSADQALGWLRGRHHIAAGRVGFSSILKRRGSPLYFDSLIGEFGRQLVYLRGVALPRQNVFAYWFP